MCDGVSSYGTRATRASGPPPGVPTPATCRAGPRSPPGRSPTIASALVASATMRPAAAARSAIAVPGSRRPPLATHCPRDSRGASARAARASASVGQPATWAAVVRRRGGRDSTHVGAADCDTMARRRHPQAEIRARETAGQDHHRGGIGWVGRLGGGSAAASHGAGVAARARARAALARAGRRGAAGGRPCASRVGWRDMLRDDTWRRPGGLATCDRRRHSRDSRAAFASFLRTQGVVEVPLACCPRHRRGNML